jgi:DNA repair ATPase RecN
MSKEKVYLAGMRMINAQSWKDCTITFDSGLNVIVAPNQTGKSVILKMLRIAVNPRGFDKVDREDFIKIGYSKSTLIYVFTDESIYKVDVTLKENRYFRKLNIKDENFEYIGTEPPEDFLHKIGSKIVGPLISNIVDMDQPMLFITSDDSATFTVVDSVTTHNDLNNLTDVINNTRIPETKEIIARLEIEKSYLDNIVNNSSYIDTTGKEEILESSHALINICSSIDKISDELFKVKEFKIININTNILLDKADTLHSSSEVLSKIHKVPKHLDKAEVLNNISECLYLNLVNLDKIPEFRNIDEDMCNRFIESVGNLDSIEYKLSTVTKFKEVDKPDKILDLIAKLDSITDKLETCISYGNIDSKIKEYSNYINKELEGGESYDCPIYGRIVLKDEECIPENC